MQVASMQNELEAMSRLLPPGMDFQKMCSIRDEVELVERFERAKGISSYLDYARKILDDIGKHLIRIPTLPKKVPPFLRGAARSARSSVRQTFAARKAAKSADGGGGSSDPDGRRPKTYTFSNPRFTLLVAAFRFGGAQ